MQYLYCLAHRSVMLITLTECDACVCVRLCVAYVVCGACHALHFRIPLHSPYEWIATFGVDVHYLGYWYTYVCRDIFLRNRGGGGGGPCLHQTYFSSKSSDSFLNYHTLMIFILGLVEWKREGREECSVYKGHVISNSLFAHCRLLW